MRAVCSAASRFEIRLSLEHFTREDEWLSLADKVKAASALKAEGNARLKDGRANLAIRKYRGVLDLLGRKVPPSSEAEARRLFISATLNLAAVYVGYLLATPAERFALSRASEQRCGMTAATLSSSSGTKRFWPQRRLSQQMDCSPRRCFAVLSHIVTRVTDGLWRTPQPLVCALARSAALDEGMAGANPHCWANRSGSATR